MDLPIYLDNASTTPVDPRVASKMRQCLTADGVFGNPSSTSHSVGWEANRLVEQARRHIASLVNAEPEGIIFTSGATESDNLAIKGGALYNENKGKHVITCETEHVAVKDTCKYLERHGFEVTYLKPASDGLLDLKELETAIREDTILISIMHVNHETGIIQDIKRIGEIAHEHNIVYHVDAAQSAGKLPINIRKLPGIDMMSFSAHKVYGPKGVGALYLRQQPRIRVEPQMHGGPQEQGFRGGTLATHQIVGMGEACRIAKAEMEENASRLRALHDRFWRGINSIEGVKLNSDLDQSCPGIFNITFGGIEGESLMIALKDLAVTSGAEGGAEAGKTSYVLKALGLNEEQSRSTIRFSIGRFNSQEEIDYTIQLIQEKIGKLRET